MKFPHTVDLIAGAVIGIVSGVIGVEWKADPVEAGALGGLLSASYLVIRALMSNH